MKTYLLFILIKFYSIYRYTSIEIKLELKKNILNFGYGINYKYEGMLAHSLDRFYVVTKFILPSIQDLNFLKLNYDGTCTYLNCNIMVSVPFMYIGNFPPYVNCICNTTVEVPSDR